MVGMGGLLWVAGKSSRVLSFRRTIEALELKLLSMLAFKRYIQFVLCIMNCSTLLSAGP